MLFGQGAFRFQCFVRTACLRCCSILFFELLKSLSYLFGVLVKTHHSGRHFQCLVIFRQSNLAFSVLRNCYSVSPSDCTVLVLEANSPALDRHFLLDLGEKEGG